LLISITNNYQIGKVKEYIHNGLMDYRNLNKELRENPEITLEAVKLDGMNLQYTSKKNQEDITIVLEAIKENKNSIEFIPPELIKNSEIKNYLNLLKNNEKQLYMIDKRV